MEAKGAGFKGKNIETAGGNAPAAVEANKEDEI